MPENTSIAAKMVQVLDRWRSAAVKVSSHASRQLSGHPVSWWFDSANASTAEIMQALASDATLVVPGRPDDSRLVTQFLRSSRPMGNTLGADAGVIREWIEAECPIDHSVSAAPTASEAASSPKLPTISEEREAFHKMANIERFPEFREKAREYANAYLANADFSASPFFAEFEYSEEEFRKRMTEIYDAFVQNDMYSVHFYDDPVISFEEKRFNVGKASNKVVVDNLVQKAPFNFLDGVWLQNIMSARPSDEVASKLFDIWADEAGNGEVEQNHANVYDNLLKSRGIYLPPVSSQEFVEYPFAPGAWRTAVFQQCVGLFPQEFFPELLGMTLYLEWEATPTLTPAVRMLRGRGIDPLFYQLHVAIDNVSSGHGALAFDAVSAFLSRQRQEGGEEELQEAWKRIWRGYVTWATVGFLGTDTFMRRLIIDKKKINVGTPEKPNCIPDLAGYYRDQMIALVRKKAPFAKQVHGGVAIGGRPLNSLFDKPEELLDLLVAEKLVDPKHPRDSRLMALMQFEGPMYRVFTEREQAVVLDWIESVHGDAYECIEPLPDTPGDDPAAAMMQLIARYAGQAKMAHDGIVLSTEAGERKPLAQMFDRPSELMGALIASGWVVAGHPERSLFLTRIVQGGGPMEGVFGAEEIATVRAWIEAGAQKSSEKALFALKAFEPMAIAPVAKRQERERQQFAAKRPQIGMGSVH